MYIFVMYVHFNIYCKIGLWILWGPGPPHSTSGGPRPPSPPCSYSTDLPYANVFIIFKMILNTYIIIFFVYANKCSNFYTKGSSSWNCDADFQNPILLDFYLLKQRSLWIPRWLSYARMWNPLKFCSCDIWLIQCLHDFSELSLPSYCSAKDGNKTFDAFCNH